LLRDSRQCVTGHCTRYRSSDDAQMHNDAVVLEADCLMAVVVVAAAELVVPRRGTRVFDLW
jgi:hypothetical protein